MKRNTLTMMALAGLLASCQQTPPPVATAAPAPAVRTTQVAPNPAEFDRQMAQAQENIRKMDEQMARLRQAQDPQERQRLLDEHWATMQDTMAMMHGVWGPGMMGCCGVGPMMGAGPMTSGGPAAGTGMMGGPPMMGGHMGWQSMGDYYSQLTPEQVKQRQYMTDQYMAMQQMMMNHMMQHQAWVNQPPEPRK